LNLQASEAYYFLSLCLIIGLGLFKLYTKRNSFKLWSPLLIVFLTLLYYTIIGPYLSLMEGETYYRLVDHRPFFQEGWRATLVFLVFLIIGFQFNFSSSKIIRTEPSGRSLRKTGLFLLYLGLGIYTLAVGSGVLSQINFVDGEFSGGGGYQGSFRNYLVYSVNFLIVSNLFLFAAWRKKQFGFIALLLILFLTFSIYTSLAFRYRHVVLFLSLAALYFLKKDKKPNLLLIAGAAIPFLIFMGTMGLYREYNRGIEIGSIESSSTMDLFLAGFGETVVFQTTAYLIDQFDSFFTHTGFDLIYNTIAFPVPRVLWSGKPDGSYLLQIVELYYGAGYGAAVLNYGELFLSFGWWGIIIGGLIWGIIFKKLWVWFQANRYNTLAQIAYAVSIAYIYVIISRGYLPQVVMLFFFTVFPAYYIIRLYEKGKIKA